MIITTAIDDSASLLIQLANPAVRALVLAIAAGLALAVFRVKAASLRLFTWTAVLYAALAMPLLGSMLTPVTIPVPRFLRDVSSQPAATLVIAPISPSTLKNEAGRNHAESLTTDSEATPAAPPIPQSSHWPSIRWTTIAIAIYLTVALLLLGRFVIGLAFGRRLLRASQTIHESRLTGRLVSRAHAMGLSVAPRAAESELISVPVTMGAFRSTILLPAAWREWDEAKLDAVFAHEVSHVARRDALTQRLSLLHRAIFWFSPLAWWLDRHLADLAEQASDEAALSCGADQNDYARILLGFFEALQASPGRVWWQGVSMAKAGQAEQRLERIFAWRGAVNMNLKKSIIGTIIALAIPVVYFAASVHAAPPNQRAQDSHLQQDQTPAPALQPKPSAAIPAIPAVADEPAEIELDQPSELDAAQSGSSYGRGYSYAYGYDDEQRFVIVTGKSDSLTMSGSTEDARHVEKLRKQIPGDFIWFQRDEKSYIIRDQATVDRARKFWAPQEELGKKQEALGKQQEALGKLQEALGTRMEQIQVKVPDMTAEADKLKAELKQLSSGASMEQISRIQEEIGELQSKIGEIQSHAGDQQGKLGEEIGALGEKQGKLGEQQGELGRQQAELAEKAARQMRDLLDEAIRKGTAQPEPQSGGTASL